MANDSIAAPPAAVALGTFTVTHEITRWSKAKLFSSPGKQSRCIVSFSSEGEGRLMGAGRAPVGFAIKFFTEDGEWDMAETNMPVLLSAGPQSGESPLAAADVWSLEPESLHLLTLLFSDRGAPTDYRHMHGYSGRTLVLINEEQGHVWCRFHCKSMQGILNFTSTEAESIAETEPGFAQRDLFDAIARGEFPKWRLCVQIMTEAEAAGFEYHPFDATKVWPQARFPLHEIGILELNGILSSASAGGDAPIIDPANEIPGIGHTPDGAGFDPCSHPDHFTQAGNFFRLLEPDAKARLIRNIAGSLRRRPAHRQACWIERFYNADPAYGKGIADELGMSLDDIFSAQPATA